MPTISGKLAGGEAAHPVHLPHAILRGGEALEKNRVLPGGALDMRNAQSVARDGGFRGDGRADLARSFGQRTPREPVDRDEKSDQQNRYAQIDYPKQWGREQHCSIVPETTMSLRLILLVAIVALNGFFAAAEVSLLSVRRSRLKRTGRKQGNVGGARRVGIAGAIRAVLLSATQVGVTLASLGWDGRARIRCIRSCSEYCIRSLRPPPRLGCKGLSFAIAFLSISFVHVVIGEVVPKNLAIEKADRLALLMAPALLVFLRISAPFVFVVERAASALSTAIGLHGGHGGGGHSPEELKFIVESSRTRRASGRASKKTRFRSCWS